MEFPWARHTEERFAQQREAMVIHQIEARDVSDPAVLAAMRRVRRHLFVPDECLADAYADGPLAIGHGQTISQPYVVASMTEALRLTKATKVLEIGTGCGYQTAVLAELAGHVYSIECIYDLFSRSWRLLKQLGYANVTTACGNGCLGWPEQAPFDAIIVTAAAPCIPEPLVHQLGDSGRLLLPLQGSDPSHQDLVLLEMHAGRLHRRTLYPVRFVPLVGCAAPSKPPET